MAKNKVSTSVNEAAMRTNMTFFSAHSNAGDYTHQHQMNNRYGTNSNFAVGAKTAKNGSQLRPSFKPKVSLQALSSPSVANSHQTSGTARWGNRPHVFLDSHEESTISVVMSETPPISGTSR